MAIILQKNTGEEINDADQRACFPWSMPKTGPYHVLPSSQGSELLCL